jgi:hypothetical protein
MFVLTTTHVFWFPVTVRMPDTDEPGKFKPQTFQMQFEAIGQDESRRLTAEYEALTDPADRAREEHSHLIRVVKDWRDVIDPTGQPVPFSEAALRAAIQIGWIRTGIYRAYAQALAGDEARLGN